MKRGEIYTADKNFTLPPALTAWTISTSVVNSIIVVTIIIMTFVRDIECIIIILAFTVIYVVY